VLIVVAHDVGRAMVVGSVDGLEARAPLFLVNHWITTDPVPLSSYADRVNAYAPLMRRLREGMRIRGHLPNLVPVNVYRRGALLQAVDTLNGVRG
jgi:hypothetical protein